MKIIAITMMLLCTALKPCLASINLTQAELKAYALANPDDHRSLNNPDRIQDEVSFVKVQKAKAFTQRINNWASPKCKTHSGFMDAAYIGGTTVVVNCSDGAHLFFDMPKWWLEYRP
jgi:hypothetical protein